MTTPPVAEGVGTLNPPNANYGKGAYRRAIRVRTLGPGAVEAVLEDDFHAFRVEVAHDGSRVTGVQSTTIRFPLNTCPGASEVLRSVVGAPLSPSILDLKKFANQKKNCTHLFDLASLCVIHAAQGQGPERRYDIHMPDPKDGRFTAVLQRDGKEVLRLEIDQGTVVGPASHAGYDIFRGFATWAVKSLTGEALEAALILQRGILVSGARRHDMKARGVMRAVDTTMPRGVCYSTLPPVMETAMTWFGHSRDFTDAPDDLLRWAP